MMIIQQETYQIIYSNQKYYKLCGINTSRQTNATIPQMNYIGKSGNDAAMFFITKKQKAKKKKE